MRSIRRFCGREIPARVRCGRNLVAGRYECGRRCASKRVGTWGCLLCKLDDEVPCLDGYLRYITKFCFYSILGLLSVHKAVIPRPGPGR